MEKSCRNRWALFFLLFSSLLQLNMIRHINENSYWTSAALFSWDVAVLTGEEQDVLLQTMKRRELDVLYQYVPADTEIQEVQSFLAAADKENIKVWLLTGEPEWGLDAEGKSVQREVERAAQYNRGLSEDACLEGIVMDCEPYLTELWDKEPEEVMNSWAAAMERGKESSDRFGLTFMVCVPYYLDTQGYEAQLTRIIQEGCDSVAIMNYYKEEEAIHIQKEISIARDANKGVIMIYEIQHPGQYGLEEVNTYYNDGFSAIKKSWKALINEFGRRGLAPALHDYRALQELADE